MSYKEFLERIDEFVEHVVEFTFVMVATGKIYKTQRFVWDNKEFCEEKEDSLVKTLEVKDLGERKPIRSKGFLAV